MDIEDRQQKRIDNITIIIVALLNRFPINKLLLNEIDEKKLVQAASKLYNEIERQCVPSASKDT